MFTFTRYGRRPPHAGPASPGDRKGQGSHVALAKWSAHPPLVSSTDRCPAGHTVACSPVVSGGGPSPSPSWEFPGADPATGLTSSVPRREASKALRPTHTPCPRRARPVGPSAPPARQRHSHSVYFRWMGRTGWRSPHRSPPPEYPLPLCPL